MFAAKRVLTSKTAWIVFLAALAFLAYHAPRIAEAIPLF